MSTAPARVQPAADAIESVLIGGDLSRLGAEDRVRYYQRVCESLSLNPLTKPFEYLTLNGKMILYARRDCTEQLRKRDRVSVAIVAREMVEGVYVVTARASLPDGRADESIGAVPIEGLKGEARANAMMKAETKAKRRVTLSVCGLGVLDETEVESVTPPKAEPVQQQPAALPAKQPDPETAPAEEPGDAAEPDPVNRQPDLAALAKAKGQTWANCVTRLNTQFSTNLGPRVAFAEVPVDHRRWLVAHLDSMPDVRKG